MIAIRCLLASALAALALTAAVAADEETGAPSDEVFCVRPEGQAYGRGDGSDWANALSGFPPAKGGAWGDGPGKIGAGDTLLVAGGEYRTVWSPGAGGAEGRPLAIRRATADSHGPAAGWEAALDAPVRIVGPGYIELSGLAFVTLDGATDEGIATASDGNRGLVIRDCRDVLVERVRTDGSVNRDSYRGLDLRSSERVTVRRSTIANCPNDAVLMLGMKQAVIEHCRLGPRIAPAPGNYGWHADLIEARGNSEIDFRWNRVAWAADGVFLFESNGPWRIYGNVFSSGPGAAEPAGKATRTHSSNKPNGPVAIHNNVFHRLYAGIAYGSETAGTARNNVFYECLHFPFGPVDHDWNYYFGCGQDVAEPHKLTGPDPFVDAAAGDFHLKAGTAAVDGGAPLEAPFNVDAAGAERPQGKGWDVGAYERPADAPPAESKPSDS